MEKRYVKPWEMAQELDVSRSLIYDLVRQRKIPSVKLGKAIRVDRIGTLKLFERGLRLE